MTRFSKLFFIFKNSFYNLFVTPFKNFEFLPFQKVLRVVLHPLVLLIGDELKHGEVTLSVRDRPTEMHKIIQYQNFILIAFPDIEKKFYSRRKGGTNVDSENSLFTKNGLKDHLAKSKLLPFLTNGSVSSRPSEN